MNALSLKFNISEEHDKDEVRPYNDDSYVI